MLFTRPEDRGRGGGGRKREGMRSRKTLVRFGQARGEEEEKEANALGSQTRRREDRYDNELRHVNNIIGRLFTATAVFVLLVSNMIFPCLRFPSCLVIGSIDTYLGCLQCTCAFCSIG